MYLATVIGQVWATRKETTLSGLRLLVVQPFKRSDPDNASTMVAVDTIGANAIYADRGPFDRHVRDIQTACQHIVGQSKGLEWVGQMMLGGAPSSPLL